MTWYRIDVPASGARNRGFVCGIDVLDGQVAKAAPIMRWAVGLRLDLVAEWVTKRGGTMEGPCIDEPPMDVSPTPMVLVGGQLRLVGRG